MKNFGYLLKEGVRSLWTNRLMSLASIGVLVACLLLIGGSFLVFLNVDAMVGYVEEQNEVVAFIKDDLEEDQLQEVEQKIYSTDNIRDIKYVSKEEALEEQKKQLEQYGEEYGELLNSENNPLPASYRLQVADLAYLQDTVQKLEAIDGIERVSASTDVADAMTGIKRVVGICGFSIVAILLVVSLMIISNTIKVTVFNRRKEINIMKYVGATNAFIRFPFLIEGMLLGLISALLAYFILWGGYTYLSGWMDENPIMWLSTFRGLVPFNDVSLKLLLSFGGFGVLIGMLGSFVFVRKHMKV